MFLNIKNNGNKLLFYLESCFYSKRIILDVVFNSQRKLLLLWNMNKERELKCYGFIYSVNIIFLKI